MIEKIIQYQSTFELLRIIAMMMIVISHFAIKGNWQEVDSLSPLKSLELLLPDTLGPIGAVIFL